MISKTGVRFSKPFAVALLAAATLAAASGPALAWSPRQAAIMTRFAKDVDPLKTLPEYPRPQMVRGQWLNLNGIWQYEAGKDGDAAPADRRLAGEILVPFPVESALSGVMTHHDRLWYRRTFTVPKEWAGKRTLLHLGAVDWECEVFVNGQSLGVHRGGYDPFSFDVTPALWSGGEQELVVRVYDPTDDYGQPRGKQSLHPGGIMYTSCTGIWQTVWLEPVAERSIASLKLVPDVDNGKLRLTAVTRGAAERSPAMPTDELRVTVKDGDQVVAALTGAPDMELDIPVKNARLWSPDSPFLYGLEVTLLEKGQAADAVSSYFGMRKVELCEQDGVKKLLLNGKFVFELGPLDQGFWPDGIYTQPTEEALKNDIQMMKDFGFNLVRKHIKVEPQRWYYWCDRLGLLVWQDMPSANSYLDKRRYPVPPIDKKAYRHEMQRMIETHWNSPSIITWVIFNEAQSQHDTVQLAGLVKRLDPSRLVNEASGNDHFGAGEVRDIHSYPPPKCPPPDDHEALACGEFGGIGFRVPGHTWTDGGSGLYTDVCTPRDLIELYAQFIGTLKGFRDEQGLSAAVYTQLTDVENEINGLMTYDRIPKLDPAEVARANRFQYPLPTYEPVLPTGERSPQPWRYTTERPADGTDDWRQPAYDDGRWAGGQALFGNRVDNVRTPWTTGDIWLRRHFDPGALSAEKIAQLVTRDVHDEDMEVYINGVEAVRRKGYIGAYEHSDISEEAKRAVRPNADNVLAVHCRQTGGGQSIDVGLSLRAEPRVP